jgi:hypothetical protein
MTLYELGQKIESVLPGAVVDFDNQGQIVIYTGLMLNDENNVVELVIDECEET